MSAPITPDDSIVVGTSFGTTVSVTKSAGVDGAVVVFIDTDYEPDGSDGGTGMRVILNDSDIYEGVPFGGFDQLETD